MNHARRRPALLLAGLFTLAPALAACGSGEMDSRTTVLRPAETSVPQGTADPRVRPAVEAYAAFVAAANEAQQHPVPEGGPFPANADLGRYSFDPVRAEYEGYISGLHRVHLAYRGTPPQSHVSVSAIDQDATPFPRVVLTDCPSGADGWQAYDTRTDAAHPEATMGVPAPRGLAVTMILNQQRWGVQTVLADPDGTCAGS